MSEQEITATPEVVEAVAAASADPKGKIKAAAKKSAKKIVAKKAKTKKSTPQTDDQKRLAKNAAVREWRAKNKERFAAYMKQWRENKKKQTAKRKTRASKKGGSRE